MRKNPKKICSFKIKINFYYVNKSFNLLRNLVVRIIDTILIFMYHFISQLYL